MKKKPYGQRINPAPSDMVVGIGWYTAPEWARVKTTAVDADLLEATFPEWEVMATDSLAMVRKRYPNATKVFIIADEFFTWRHLRGLANDAKTRAQFVAEKLRATSPSLPPTSPGSGH